MLEMPEEMVHIDSDEDLELVVGSRDRGGRQGLPRDRRVGEDLETLSDSRNLFPVRFDDGDSINPFSPDDLRRDVGVLEACIDLEEPQYVDKDGRSFDSAFIMRAGETRDIRFTYNVGIPQAHAFGVFFFERYSDSLTLRNPVVLQQPTVVITPQVPVDDATGYYKHEGNLRITIPMSAPDFENYYGVLIIYQEGFDGIKVPL